MNITRYGNSNDPVLSILICAVKSREEKYLARLMERIHPQLTGKIEAIVGMDNGEAIIGAKRNVLMNAAAGEYTCFVDDDDLIPFEYGKRILVSAELKPAAIGFRLRRLIDGKYDADAIHSVRNGRWETTQRDGKKVYLRTPNHLNPIRRDISIRYPFPEKNHGEDRDFSVAVKAEIDRESEVFIDGQALYIYEYRTNPRRVGEVVNKQK